MPNEELVATLRLLLGAHGQEALRLAVYEATTLPEAERVKLVCASCGSDQLTFNGSGHWDPLQNGWHNVDMEGKAWCNSCEEECHDEEKPYLENKPPTKPSGDP